jgi:hypothetical protein
MLAAEHDRYPPRFDRPRHTRGNIGKHRLGVTALAGNLRSGADSGLGRNIHSIETLDMR